MKVVTAALRNEQANVTIFKVQDITAQTLSFFPTEFLSDEDGPATARALQDYLFTGYSKGVEYKEISADEGQALVDSVDEGWMLSEFFPS